MVELKSLFKYFIKYKWRLSLGILFVCIANVFAVLPPMVIRSILDYVYGNITVYRLFQSTPLSESFGQDTLKMVMLAGLVLILLALTRGIFMFFMRQTIIVMSRHIEYDQKNEIYEHYQKLDTAFFKSQKTGDLMSRITEDVSRVRMYTGPAIMYTLNLIVLTIMAVWGMVNVNLELSIYALFFLPLLAISMIKINGLINKKSGKIQAQLGQLTALAQESFSGIRVIKSYVKEEETQETFEKASNKYRNSNLSLAKIESMYTPLMGVFIGLSLIITVYLGGRFVINGAITIGNIAEFIIYITMLTFPVSTLGWTSSIIQRAASSQKRINEFLKTEPKIKDDVSEVSKTIIGNIKFEQVEFTYPGNEKPALKNINLEVKAGEKIAIIGKTGSGKTTLAHLLLRMYDVDKGQIYIDDTPIKSWKLSSLRPQLAYVPQEVFLFSDTINNNISFGQPEHSEITNEEAAKMAAIHTEISKLPEQYETLVGERGVMLSGGQKQRISIARALAAARPILILDDSISAVDTDTEQRILNSLSQHLEHKTAIVITHRLFKSWHFDQIIVMDEGKIVAQGTHEQLMAQKGYYFELFQYQNQGTH